MSLTCQNIDPQSTSLKRFRLKITHCFATHSGTMIRMFHDLFKLLLLRKGSEQLLRAVEAMKLVQALIGSAGFGGFVHAQTYADTKGDMFGVLTASSTTLSFAALLLTTMMTVDVGSLDVSELDVYINVCSEQRYQVCSGSVIATEYLGHLSATQLIP